VDAAPAEARPSPRRRFEELLRSRTDRPVRDGQPPPRRPLAARRAAAPDPHALGRPAERRRQIRAELDASAGLRAADGVRATTEATGRLRARARALLHSALRAELRLDDRQRTRSHEPGLGGPHTGEPLAGTGPAGSAVGVACGAEGGRGEPEAGIERVERALQLVERIERFVRSGRPALALTLRGALRGHLELRREAPGIISLLLASPRPPSSSELQELRQALEARGLSVQTLAVAPLTASGTGACSPCP